MAVPTLTLRVDWENAGTFTASALDTVSPLLGPEKVVLTRGRSADFSTEAVGQLTFTLDNSDNAYTPDRNWADNPSFEVSTTGWSTAAVASLTLAATSITQVTDNAPNAGTKAGQAVLPASTHAGVNYAVPYLFRNGSTYSYTFWLKSISGSTGVQCGIASSGTPADISTAAGTITGSWVAYSGTWTPSANRTDAVLFVRTTGAAAATLNIDAIGLNPGSTTNTYLEAPTKGQLIPGRPVHLYATFAATNYPKFYGFIERITPNPTALTVDFTCYDVLRKMSEFDVSVPANPFIERSARDLRIAVLEDFERGTLNLLPNPSFETNTNNWLTQESFGSPTVTRITNDAAPGAGTCCVEWVAGSSGATNCYLYAPLYLKPAVISGEVYRVLVALRAPSGTPTVTIALADASTLASGSFTAAATDVVTLTSSWQTFTMTGTAGASYPPSGTSQGTGAVGPFALVLMTTGGTTVRVDQAMVTRGQGQYAYADVGTGRWPNSCMNGSFDGQALNGWYDSFTNLCTNGNFETNATGWTAVAQNATQHFIGANCGKIAAAATGKFAMSGTFVLGVQYGLSFWMMASGTCSANLGSSGTPADSVTVAITASGVWQNVVVRWTPSANRTDGQISVTAGNASFIDAVVCVRVDSATVNVPQYSDTGPGGGGSFTTSNAISTATVQYGSSSQQVVTPATSGAGMLYDFNHCGAYFVASRAYTLSVWLNATTAMPYKVGLAHNLGTGAWEDHSTTGTLTANTWTQVTLTVTPSVDYSSANPYDTVLYIHQTNATGRTYFIDGVRVIPGGSADSFELPQWSIPAAAEPDVFSTTAGITAYALPGLSQINGLTLSRHWIVPTMSAPWYAYTVEDRTAFLTKATVDTFTENVQGWEQLDIDRTAILNVVPVGFTSPTEYYSDATSVATYGLRAASAISGASFYSGRATAALIGAAVLARYKDPRARPKLTVQNQWPSQLADQLEDAIAVTVARFCLQAGKFVILNEKLTITDALAMWITVWQLEEYPY